MSKDEIMEALEGNEIAYRKIGSEEISNIMAYVPILLKIDEKTQDYFYQIDIEDLMESDMPTDDLADLKEEGWSLDDSERFLILYINI